MKFTLIGNAAWILEIDETLSRFKVLKITRKISPVYQEDSFRNMDIWLLTHNHFDHLDNEGLRQIDKDSRIFSIRNCRVLLKKKKGLQVSYMKWNDLETLNLKGYDIRIKAVPAFHGKGFLGLLVCGRVNGYLVNVSKGNARRTVYITSDTLFSREIKKVIGDQSIDLMIPNLGKVKSRLPGGPFTMDIPMLKHFINELKPEKVLPIHINDYSHFETEKRDLQNQWETLENGESLVL